jgi:hypothetical protein
MMAEFRQMQMSDLGLMTRNEAPTFGTASLGRAARLVSKRVVIQCSRQLLQ